MTQALGNQTVIHLLLTAHGRWKCMLGDTELESESDSLADALRALANSIDAECEARTACFAERRAFVGQSKGFDAGSVGDARALGDELEQRGFKKTMAGLVALGQALLDAPAEVTVGAFRGDKR